MSTKTRLPFLASSAYQNTYLLIAQKARKSTAFFKDKAVSHVFDGKSQAKKFEKK